MYKHANAGEGRETPAQLSPGIANCTHPVNMVKERRKKTLLLSIQRLTCKCFC